MRTVTVNEASRVCGGLVGSDGLVGPNQPFLLSYTNTIDSGGLDSGLYANEQMTWYTDTGMCYRDYGSLPPEPGLQTVFTLPIGWVGRVAGWIMGTGTPAPLPQP